MIEEGIYMQLSNNDKINLIKKYYKKEKIFLELSLLNYEGYNIYIILNYNKKHDCYKLRWFDLSLIVDSDIDKYMSCSSISNNIINVIEDDFSSFTYSSIYLEDIVEDKDIVTLKVNVSTGVDDIVDIKFKKYLPKTLGHLIDLFVFIFSNMSKKYEDFLDILMAKITDSTSKYDYKEEIYFDLFRDDIDKLFDYLIVQRGKRYYSESKVNFLEKFDDRYFAVVDGTEKYVIVIKYDEKLKKMHVYCSCPCEFYCKHMYAVILAIRNKEFNKFYKIIYSSPDKNLLEKITDFKYFLCVGIYKKKFIIVNNHGVIEYLPMFDEIGRYNWEILEDSCDGKLGKQVKLVLECVDF